MHAEAVQTRVFNMTPVTEDAQLHDSVDLITGVLHGGQEQRRKTTEHEAVRLHPSVNIMDSLNYVTYKQLKGLGRLSALIVSERPQ